MSDAQMGKPSGGNRVQVTLLCDQCGTLSTGDYIVAATMSRPQRLGAVRDWMARNAGWSHTEGTDLCRTCTGDSTPSREEKRKIMRILRHEVPADDEWHNLFSVMNPLSAGCRDARTVEFWSWELHDGPWPERFFRVYGTGADIPGPVRYWGTAVAPGGFLVWHLVEATGELAEELAAGW